MKLKKLLILGSALILTANLASCGGDSNDGSSTSNTVDVSTSTSTSSASKSASTTTPVTSTSGASNTTEQSSSTADTNAPTTSAQSTAALESSTNESTAHTHSYTLKHDETKHYDECECGDKKNEGVHSFIYDSLVSEATEEQAGSIKLVCSVCGYDKVIAYDKYKITTSFDEETETNKKTIIEYNTDLTIKKVTVEGYKDDDLAELLEVDITNNVSASGYYYKYDLESSELILKKLLVGTISLDEKLTLDDYVLYEKINEGGKADIFGNSSGYESYEIKYEYDANNNLAKKTYTYNDDTYSFDISYVYENDIITSKIEASVGFTQNTVYTYQNGVAIKENVTQLYNDENIGGYEADLYYDLDGKLSYKKLTYKEDNTIECIKYQKYTVDLEGNTDYDTFIEYENTTSKDEIDLQYSPVGFDFEYSISENEIDFELFGYKKETRKYYDENDNILGVLVVNYTYTDSKLAEITLESKDSSSNLFAYTKIIYEYDETGEITGSHFLYYKETDISEEGTSVTIRTYNDSYKLLTEVKTITDEDSTYTISKENTYNANGNTKQYVLKLYIDNALSNETIINYDEDEYLADKTINEYEDSILVSCEKIICQADEFVSHTKYDYTYENNAMTKMEYYSYDDESDELCILYIVSEGSFNSDNSIITGTITKYEYQEDESISYYYNTYSYLNSLLQSETKMVVYSDNTEAFVYNYTYTYYYSYVFIEYSAEDSSQNTYSVKDSNGNIIFSNIDNQYYINNYIGEVNYSAFVVFNNDGDIIDSDSQGRIIKDGVEYLYDNTNTEGVLLATLDVTGELTITLNDSSTCHSTFKFDANGLLSYYSETVNCTEVVYYETKVEGEVTTNYEYSYDEKGNTYAELEILNNGEISYESKIINGSKVVYAVSIDSWLLAKYFDEGSYFKITGSINSDGDLDYDSAVANYYDASTNTLKSYKYSTDNLVIDLNEDSLTVTLYDSENDYFVYTFDSNGLFVSNAFFKSGIKTYEYTSNSIYIKYSRTISYDEACLYYDLNGDIDIENSMGKSYEASSDENAKPTNLSPDATKQNYFKIDFVDGLICFESKTEIINKLFYFNPNGTLNHVILYQDGNKYIKNAYYETKEIYTKIGDAWRLSWEEIREEGTYVLITVENNQFVRKNIDYVWIENSVIYNADGSINNITINYWLANDQNILFQCANYAGMYITKDDETVTIKATSFNPPNESYDYIISFLSSSEIKVAYGESGVITIFYLNDKYCNVEEYGYDNGENFEIEDLKFIENYMLFYNKIAND